MGWHKAHLSCSLAVLALASCVHAVQWDGPSRASIASSPSRPVWPDAYEVAYTIELPYVASIQPTPLKYPVHVWYDGTKDLLRTSFYDGLDETFITQEATYEVYPRIYKRSCLVFNHTVGPTLTGAESNDLAGPLPEIGDDWQYGGAFTVKGRSTHMWQMTYRVDEKVNTYTLHTSQEDGRPLQLHMVGVNLLTGSHYDQYEVDFTLWRPGANAASFAPPSVCKAHHGHASQPPAPAHHTVLQQTFSLFPSSWVPNGVSGHITAQTLGNRQGAGLLAGLQGLLAHWYGSETTSETDTATVLDNLRFIHDWNQARSQQIRAEAAAANHSRKALAGVTSSAVSVTASSSSPVAAVDLYKMGINKFVAWSEQRFAGTMLGRAPASEELKERRRAEAQGAYLGEYERTLADEELPDSVDWRGSGADGPVKDQASCGSCWTFATTGAMRGQWFTATGQALSFSEQQIVDCSWDYDVNGCWGGDTEPAMQYIHAAGGPILEADYPYLGQNSYCKDGRHPKAATFKGYKSIPKHDEKALMEAVYLHGPLSIAFDAGDKGFKYYSEGVYYRESCGTKVRDLNHAVTLVGYGTTWNGTDYWLLRNSWSVAWGNDGYFKLARKGNDCGVTTDAVLTVPDEEAVARAVARSKAASTHFS